MAESKEFPLSIVLRTVDKATAGINAVNKRLDAMTKPVRDFKKALGDLGESSGLASVIDGFKGVGSAIGDLLGKVAMIGGVVGVAVAGLVHLVGEFDDLGDKAERLGVGADFLAGLHFAAERSGASVEALDSGIQTFTVNLGLARAGMGKMVKALQTVAPELLVQLKHTKNNEQALLLMANAFAAIKDPAKKAALAARTGLGPELVPLLSKGSKGVAELLERFHELAPGITEAADAAGKTDDAFKDLNAATTGVKAAIVTGLAPAMTVVVKKLTQWFVDHRADIQRWAADVGERIPAAIEKVITWVGRAVDSTTKFVDGIGGWKVAALGVAAVIAGPLISAIVSLGLAMASTPLGLFLAGAAELLLLAKTIHDTGGPRSSASFTAEEAALKSGAIPGGFGRAPSRTEADLMRSGAIPKSNRFRIDEGRMNAINRESSANVASTRAQDAKVTVEFKNAPPGMRAAADPQSNLDVDLAMGFAMGFAP